MPSRRRTSPKAEPLDLDRELDEMYASAITRPNLGFLRVGNFPAPPLATEVTPDIPPTDALPSNGVMSTGTRARDTTSMDARSIDRTSLPTECDGGAGDVVAIDTTSQAPVSMDSRPPGKWKLHRCSTVQDGHSANEQLLYEMLWRSAKAVNPDERLLSISREDMASQTRITVRNVKGVVDRLIEKLAIEKAIESNSFIRAAATYRVYSYRAILERRRSAGLEWVTRANGVKFIPAQMARELLSRPQFTEADHRQPTGAIDSRSPDLLSRDVGSVDLQSTDVRSSDVGSMDDRGGLSKPFSSLPVPNDLGLGLRKINPAFDSAAVARLWRECRARVPDCTVEEVLHFSNLKASKLWADKNIRSTIGLLLTSVPELFDPAIVHDFREEKRRQILEEARIAQENENYWRAVLEDVSSTDADRSTALQFIGSSTRTA